MNVSISPNYYLQTKKYWVKFYLNIANNKKIDRYIFKKYFEAPKITELKLKIKEEFEGLLPQIPDIGGKKNKIFTSFMVLTAISLAFYRVLKVEGFQLHQIGQIIYEIGEIYYMNMNPIMKHFMHWYYFSPASQRRVKKETEELKTRANPADYQAAVIEGDGKNLLWGLNYTECGGLKFLKQQNALEIAPYLCLSDYSKFRAIKVGFARNQNLAIGGTCCDFRFYKNYPTPIGWPPENLPEYRDFFTKEDN